MPYCSECGRQVTDYAEYCPECGAQIGRTSQRQSAPSYQEPTYRDPSYQNSSYYDTPHRESRSQKSSYPTRSDGKIVTGTKSPFLAAILSFFIPGLGLMYAGRIGLGLVILILAVLFGITILGLVISLILWLYGIFKAYSLCNETNFIWYTYLRENRN